MTQLDPYEAAQLFYSGSVMVFSDTPDEPFACGQWMGRRAMVTPIPFDDAVSYFTTHPVMIYDPNSPVTPPVPAVSATITAGTPTNPAK